MARWRIMVCWKCPCWETIYYLGHNIKNIFSPLGKLLIDVLLVTAGFGVSGAFGGMVIGTSIAFGIMDFAIWDFVQHGTEVLVL